MSKLPRPEQLTFTDLFRFTIAKEEIDVEKFQQLQDSLDRVERMLKLLLAQNGIGNFDVPATS